MDWRLVTYSEGIIALDDDIVDVDRSKLLKIVVQLSLSDISGEVANVDLVARRHYNK
jgi:hypothetical protein